jgi:hypothetical protein
MVFNTTFKNISVILYMYMAVSFIGGGKRYTVIYNNVRYKLNSYQTCCDTNNNVSVADPGGGAPGARPP